jgi:hypothetical protein
MTSFRQIAANRRNAAKSTGPTTDEGKQRSRCNAIRDGLTVETVIGALEDAADYRAFEAAITAEYDAESAVERELVLRLASLLWRLRRATTIETGLFEIQADDLSNFKKTRQVRSDAQQIVYAMFAPPSPINEENESTPPLVTSDPLITGDPKKPPRRATPSASHMVGSNFDFARCFLRLANLPNFALDRLSRYEATLWRQAAQTLFALDQLNGRKRGRRFFRARIF